MPSLGGGGTGGIATPCAAQYGTATAYFDCNMPNANDCTFYVQPGGANCNQLCAQFGGECLDATGDGTGSTQNCIVGSTITCATTAQMDLICSCSLGCGGGPACAAAATCVNGSCV
jgi:hypothetical protein